MPEQLKAHLAKFVYISDSEFEEILSFFEMKSVRKKENVLEAKELCQEHFFVLKGILRKFFITEKGTEQTTEFAIENWWLTDNIAYEHQQKTEFYIQTVEPCELLTLSQKNQTELLNRFPVLERYFRFVYQRAYAAAQMRIKYIFSYSKDEFYLHLLENYPEFVQRVPQYLIASFLGFTPEYLSEIRKKNLS